MWLNIKLVKINEKISVGFNENMILHSSTQKGNYMITKSQIEKLKKDTKLRQRIGNDLDVTERTILNWAKTNTAKLNSLANQPIVLKHLKN